MPDDTGPANILNQSASAAEQLGEQVNNVADSMGEARRVSNQTGEAIQRDMSKVTDATRKVGEGIRENITDKLKQLGQKLQKTFGDLDQYMVKHNRAIVDATNAMGAYGSSVDDILKGHTKLGASYRQINSLLDEMATSGRITMDEARASLQQLAKEGVSTADSMKLLGDRNRGALALVNAGFLEMSDVTGFSAQAISELGATVENTEKSLLRIVDATGKLNGEFGKSVMSTRILVKEVMALQSSFKFLGTDVQAIPGYITAFAAAAERFRQETGGRGVSGRAAAEIARQYGQNVAGMNMEQRAFFGQMAGMGGGLAAGERFRLMMQGEGGTGRATSSIIETIQRLSGAPLMSSKRFEEQDATGRGEYAAQARARQALMIQQLGLGGTEQQAYAFLDLAGNEDRQAALLEEMKNTKEPLERIEAILERSSSANATYLQTIQERIQDNIDSFKNWASEWRAVQWTTKIGYLIGTILTVGSTIASAISTSRAMSSMGNLLGGGGGRGVGTAAQALTGGSGGGGSGFLGGMGRFMGGLGRLAGPLAGGVAFTAGALYLLNKVQQNSATEARQEQPAVELSRDLGSLTKGAKNVANEKIATLDQQLVSARNIREFQGDFSGGNRDARRQGVAFTRALSQVEANLASAQRLATAISAEPGTEEQVEKVTELQNKMAAVIKKINQLGNLTEFVSGGGFDNFSTRQLQKLSSFLRRTMAEIESDWNELKQKGSEGWLRKSAWQEATRDLIPRFETQLRATRNLVATLQQVIVGVLRKRGVRGLETLRGKITSEKDKNLFKELAGDLGTAEQLQRGAMGEVSSRDGTRDIQAISRQAGRMSNVQGGKRGPWMTNVMLQGAQVNVSPEQARRALATFYAHRELLAKTLQGFGFKAQEAMDEAQRIQYGSATSQDVEIALQAASDRKKGLDKRDEMLAVEAPMGASIEATAAAAESTTGGEKTASTAGEVNNHFLLQLPDGAVEKMNVIAVRKGVVAAGPEIGKYSGA